MIDHDALLNFPIPEVRHRFTSRDTMLYALGLGLGEPVSTTCAQEMRFVYEKSLAALPTMGLVLGYPGLWMADPATGIDVKRMLHGAQILRVMRPLPVQGEVVGRSKVVAIQDKGAGRDAVVVTRRQIHDVANGALLCELDVISILRGQGGFGGSNVAGHAFATMPERAPDFVDRWHLDSRAALIYRLSGDYNPLHVDHELASAIGFPKPLLHGLCTLGTAVCGVARAALGWEVERIGTIAARFTAPAFPGQTLRIEAWRDGLDLSFRCFTEDGSDTCVLDNGSITLVF